MIRLYSLLLILLLPCCLAAQPKGKPAKHIVKHKYGRGVVVEAPAPPEVFVTVELQPEFVGGLTGLEKYLSQVLHYPALAKEAGVQGKVLVRFMVMEDGSINNIQVVRSIGYGCDEEAQRVVKAMPRWKPGRLNGKPVRSVYILPVLFKIEQ